MGIRILESMKILIMGNAGSGKTTMAHRIVGNRDTPQLSLDEIAWAEGVERRPLRESIDALHRFIAEHDHWVIEGCYGDLIEAAVPHCSELRFLNPGIEACVENCKQRDWEPEKFLTDQAQRMMLDLLVQWIREYETRDDEFGLVRHRGIFEGFSGTKTEYSSLDAYQLGPLVL